RRGAARSRRGAACTNGRGARSAGTGHAGHGGDGTGGERGRTRARHRQPGMAAARAGRSRRAAAPQVRAGARAAAAGGKAMTGALRAWLVLLLFACAGVQAETRAWLDRDSIVLAERATLNIETDQATVDAPDYG